MPAEKLIRSIKLIQLNLKSMGLLYFIPYVFLFLILPLSTYISLTSGTAKEQCFLNSYFQIQMFCPFFAVWWTLFGFREFSEGKMRELLLVYQKSILKELIIVWVYYILHMIIMLVLYLCLFGFNYFHSMMILTIQSFAFFSVGISLSFLIKNIALSFVICILYELIGMFGQIDILQPISMLSLSFPQNFFDGIVPYLFILLVSMILLIFSNLFAKKYA